MPADRVQRQPQTGRRLPLQQDDPATAQLPVGTGPAGIVLTPVQRQHPGGRDVGGLLEPGQQRRPGLCGIGEQVLGGLHGRAGRLAHRTQQPRQWVFVGRSHLGDGQAEAGCQFRDQAVRSVIGGGLLAADPRVGQQRLVAPQRLPIPTPVEPNLPARQRFSGIPLALAALHQALRGPHRLQQTGQHRSPLAFVRSVGVGVPLGI